MLTAFVVICRDGIPIMEREFEPRVVEKEGYVKTYTFKFAVSENIEGGESDESVGEI